jgi:amidase
MRPKLRLIPWLLFLLSVLPAVAAGAAAEPRVVRYEPKDSDFKYVYGTMAPVATLRPGDVLDTRTADCFGGVIQKPGDSLSKVKGDNPLTGPFAIEGAEPGDTLVVKILDLKVDGPRGVGALAPGFGMLNPPLPERVWFYDIDGAANTATFQPSVRWRSSDCHPR